MIGGMGKSLHFETRSMATSSGATLTEKPPVADRCLVRPQVPYIVVCGRVKPDLGPGDPLLRRVASLVENQHGPAAVEQRLVRPDADLPSVQTICPWMPRGSWLTAMASRLVRCRPRRWTSTGGRFRP